MDVRITNFLKRKKSLLVLASAASCYLIYDYNFNFSNMLSQKFLNYFNKDMPRYLYNNDPFLKSIIRGTKSANKRIRDASISLIKFSNKFSDKSIKKLATELEWSILLTLMCGTGPCSSEIIKYFHDVYDYTIEPYKNMNLLDLEDEINQCVVHLPKYNLGKSGNYVRSLLLSDDNDSALTQSERHFSSNYEHGDIDFFVFNSFSQNDRILLYLQVIYHYSMLPQAGHILLSSKLPMLLCGLLSHVPENSNLSDLIIKIFLNLSSFQSLHPAFRDVFPFLMHKYANSNDIEKYYMMTFSANFANFTGLPTRFYPGVYLAYPNKSDPASEPDMDIVLIHGIGGKPFNTWRVWSKNKSERNVIWPIDWISEDFPNVRVLSVEYHSDFTKWRHGCPVDTFDVDSLSPDLLSSLSSSGIGQRPIVWICHSIGGLIVKKLLIDNSPISHQFSKKTKGIIFFGVPHKGSPPASLLNLFLPAINLDHVVPNSKWILKLSDEFKTIVEENKIKILNFGEALPSSIYGLIDLMIIPYTHYEPGFGESFILPETDHINVCKLKDRDDLAYTQIKILISDILSSKK